MSRAVIVPDQATWTMWGRDPGRHGFIPAATPEQARELLVPDPVPRALCEAVREAWQRMPPPRSYVSWPRALPGVPASELLSQGGHGPSGGADEDHRENAEHSEEDQGEDHESSGEDHDMMAIVGDPSADGLVMEWIDFELGPLAAALPGGLVLDLSLDGDVVGRCEARATLAMPLGPIAGGTWGDPTASAAWTAATALAFELAAGVPAAEATARVRIAAVETERALSHLSWLRAFGFVLGWPELAQRADRAVEALAPARTRLERAAALGEAGGREETAILDASSAPVDRVRLLLDGSRRLRSRTRGRAETAIQRVVDTGLGGPAARAAGVTGDARTRDPLYEALGFREVCLAEGDAEARTVLRTAEAAAALELAAAALAEVGSAEAGAPDLPAEALVEGPRGSVRAAFESGRLQIGAPGAAAALELAGEAITGLEVGSALVGLASFDLSGWQVGG